MKYCIGMDIGGTHISAALADRKGYVLTEKSFYSVPVDPLASPSEIINKIEDCLLEAAIHFSDHDAEEMLVGIAMPGPFDYENGVSEIRGVNKFDQLFGLNIRQTLLQRLEAIVGINAVNIHFINDAQAFLKGAIVTKQLQGKKIIGITLGTGIGAAFFDTDSIIQSGNNIPANGYIYNSPYLDGIAEDYLSTQWLLKQFNDRSPQITSVLQIGTLANKGDASAIKAFETYGAHLGAVLAPFISAFKADAIVAGGGILQSFHLFEKSFRNSLQKQGVENIEFISCNNTRETAIIGAMAHACEQEQQTKKELRKTSQWLLPVNKPSAKIDSYDIYPATKIESGKIHIGLGSITELLAEQRNIVIDGYAGVDWDSFLIQLTKSMEGIDCPVNFFNIESALYSKEEIIKKTAAYLDSDGEASIFGKLCDLEIKDFFDPLLLNKISPENNCINILYGSGAACAGWKAPVLYIDVPKNEIQFRSRAGWVENLGKIKESDSKKQYKRFYFIDWPILNRHKASLLPSITLLIDGQRQDDYTVINGNDFRNTLSKISQEPFRARPWFEPGTWGGQWIKNNIDGLCKEVPNYAWSFELISPENGLLLEADGLLFEFSFDWLLFAESAKLLGKASERFGTYFPIRFDFLDTIDGGNLSVQVHPTLNYMKENFGEPITQDETYYIVEAKEEALVYLGFQDKTDPHVFEDALKTSVAEKKAINIKKFVQAHPAKKHDLFLIPSGTIHGSGADNLVLEISCTPYIYTFKLYDWLRMDLDGKPRPINIDHGMKNLDFKLAGEKVKSELISTPVLLEKGECFERWSLPTHEKHLYAIERYVLNGEVSINANGHCHIGMLVEGDALEINTDKLTTHFSFAETFIIPAAASNYRICHTGKSKAVVVISYVKDSYC